VKRETEETRQPLNLDGIAAAPHPIHHGQRRLHSQMGHHLPEPQGMVDGYPVHQVHNEPRQFNLLQFLRALHFLPHECSLPINPCISTAAYTSANRSAISAGVPPPPCRVACLRPGTFDV